MSALRFASAVAALVLAGGLVALAHDLRTWDDGIERGDRAYADAPSEARWTAASWLPGDPAGAILGVETRLELRHAIQSFTRAVDVPQGIDNGERRARMRAAAEVALAAVAESGDAEEASQASNLIGVLAETELEGPTTSRGRAAFEAAVRADAANEAAAYNLELILRRARIVGAREGPGSDRARVDPRGRGPVRAYPGWGTDVLALSIELLDPRMLALAIVAALPVAAGVAVVVRSRGAARTLGLAPAPLARTLAPLAAAGLACVAGAAAAAQPVLETTEVRKQRTASQVVFVVDVSRSMRAASSAEGPTRLDRARAIVRSLRASVEDVPAGLTGLTDRALPYVFPTGDERAFDDVLARSVAPEAPPPITSFSIVATSFEPLATLGRAGFYSPGARFRTCVLVTDGEARTGGGEPEDAGSGGGLTPAPPSLAPDQAAPSAAPSDDPAASGATLASRRGCRLVAVRVGSGADRIYGPDGVVEAQYRPDAAAASTLERFAEAAGGSAFTEDDVDEASDALREAAEQGPVGEVARRTSSRALAPYLAGLAALLAVVTALSRTLRRGLRRQVSAE